MRVLWELWAAGLADEELAAGWRVGDGGWRELLDVRLRRWAAANDVELPLSPQALSSLVANLFQGIEVEMLAGVAEEEAPHREVLDAFGELIARAEARPLVELAARDGTRLAVMLTPGGAPAVLILSGSGPLDRDSNMKGQALNVGNALADALAAHGIASLRYDKRGVGESGGEYLTAGFQQETDDARAALEALPDERAVVGHSVGATIAIRLAAEYELAGVVLLCAGLAPGTEVMREQSERIAQTVPRLGRRFFLGPSGSGAAQAARLDRRRGARRHRQAAGVLVPRVHGVRPRAGPPRDPVPGAGDHRHPATSRSTPPVSGASEGGARRHAVYRREARTASPTCCGPARTRRACARTRGS